MFDSREKIALFIDGPSLLSASRGLGFEIDYRLFFEAFRRRGYLLRAYFYSVVIEDDGQTSMPPLIDWLDYNGFQVVTKVARAFTDLRGRRVFKGNMTVELAIDAIEQAAHVDHLVIVSGDSVFLALVEALQRKGRRVSIVSTKSTQPPIVADDLRRQADHFIDLVTLQREISRDRSKLRSATVIRTIHA
ncbi:NYN domain-containing protein [Sinorhizobium medicae]|uniref:NYN domain-containing protein n=1 Tax=Sinorhizobium medicae TaxID=110321 RepID=A0ABX4TEZ5_9HYPH|nr:NYN domain-containing protein [Sinorhizobium medicae]PLT96770.1 NYN domain-containing protein [Sinorhizobium medicae]PLU15278.1 NYN domain-containing protein [Sinorhizobium medicae]PLU81752.1 NYN domain-containing protein [Sinorhizobium medicae]